MNCLICDGSMSFFLSKKFTYCNIGKVRYYKCKHCGFVQARELIELSQPRWEQIGLGFLDKFYFDKEVCIDRNRSNRLRQQASLLAGLCEDGLLSNGLTKQDYARGDWLDYACGDGELIRLLSEKRISVDGYDRYNFKYRVDTKFDYNVVINTSYLEHVRYSSEFFWLERLVRCKEGALALNTLICSEIPDDPDWFYFLPVHCSFFTNRAAEILFDRWNYSSCIYSPDARMWIWFKKQLDSKDVPNYYLFKQNGFLGYW